VDLGSWTFGDIPRDVRGDFKSKRERGEGEGERKCMRVVHFDNDNLFYNAARAIGSMRIRVRESISEYNRGHHITSIN
jgi:hypothetical protein